MKVYADQSQRLTCDECGKEGTMVEFVNYNDDAFYICRDCIEKAFHLVLPEVAR